MNRTEFMSALEKRLSPLSKEDRDDALRYYDELFDEAGPIEEQNILDGLDDPDTIARQILSDNGVAPDGRPEFMIDDVITPSKGAGTPPPPKSTVQQLKEDFSGMNRNTKILLIVALLIVTSPVWGGILSGVLGLIFGLIGIIFGLVVAFSGAAVGLVVSGIIYLFKIPPIGLCILGIGLIVVALDILVIYPMLKWAIGLMIRFIKWAIDTVKGFIAKRSEA